MKMKKESRQRRGDKREQSMKPMAERSEREHLQPAEGAADLLPNRFPPLLARLTVGGLAIGAVLGLVVAIVSWAGVIPLPGSEQLYSDGELTYGLLWAALGGAAGAVVGGWVAASRAERP